VFRGARLLGGGVTRPPPGAHAEVVAIEAVRRRHGARTLRGASLAVTLEPCAHQGRTGPCTRAIVEAGLRRVFVGCRDPHPAVSGRGLRQLRAAGLAVETGVLELECAEHHRGFLSVWGRGRPFVTLKLASTLDGRIATATGESRWITSPQSRAFVHRLRARVDAVMVGSQTALADDPELSARRGGRVVHRPLRVLVDSGLRVPASARLYRSVRAEEPAAAQTLVLCARGAPGRSAIEATGACVRAVRRRGRHLDLDAALERVGEQGPTTLHWMLAPKLLGGDAIAALGDLGSARLRDALPLESLRVARIGPDVHLHALLPSARSLRAATRER